MLPVRTLKHRLPKHWEVHFQRTYSQEIHLQKSPSLAQRLPQRYNRLASPSTSSPRSTSPNPLPNPFSPKLPASPSSSSALPRHAMSFPKPSPPQELQSPSPKPTAT